MAASLFPYGHVELAQDGLLTSSLQNHTMGRSGVNITGETDDE